MKRIIIGFGSILLLVGGFTVFYGFTPKIEKEIIAGLKNGDAEKIATFFADDIEFSEPGFEDMISKTEAKTKLLNFFDRNQIINYSPKHGGSSKRKTSNFLIGNLETTSGDFRVNIFLKYGKIEQLSFTEEISKNDKNHLNS